MRITQEEISVIIPVRNGTPVLARAFNSIRSISKQIEIVIIENGSSDETLALANNFADSRTQVIHLETPGVSNARNVGIATATGSVVTLLDADDEMLKDRIDLIVSREWNDTDLIIGTMKHVDSEEANFPPEIKIAISKGLPMYGGTPIAFLKKGLVKIGGFDTKINYGEDLDFIMRAKSVGFQIIYTDTPFLIRHFHTENVSLNRPALLSGMFSALRKNIETNSDQNSSIKILHVMPNYFPHKGGIETLMSQYFDLQAENPKFTHSIITLRRQYDLNAQKTNGVNTVDEVVITWANLEENIVHTSLIILKQLREKIQKYKPQIIHLHEMHELSKFTLKLGRDLGIPVIFHFHGNLEEKDHRILKPVAPIMKNVLSVSEATRKLLADLLPSGVLIHMIPNGVKDQGNIPRSGIKSTEPLLLLVGRAEREKGFDLAIEAVAIIKREIPDVKLLVLGNGAQLKELAVLAEELGIADSVQFKGSVANEKVIEYLDESWIVLVPSRVEGFSITAVEAALREVPVIASSVGGLIETIEDGKSGFLVPPESPEFIAKKVVELIKNRKLRDDVGRYSRARALELYGIERFAEELEDYYLKIYERRNKE